MKEVKQMGFLTTTDISKTPRPMQIKEEALVDLMLRDYLDRIFDIHEGGKTFDWTRFFTADTEDILFRREVLTELSRHPALVSKITDVCKCLSQIHAFQEMPVSGEFYAESIREFSVLHLAHTTMQALYEMLEDLSSSGSLRSRGLLLLKDMMKEKVASNFTADFDQKWNELAGGLDQLGSFRVRLTMDGELHVVGAALTHIQKERFVGSIFSTHPIKELRQKEKPWDLSALKEMKTPAEELIRIQLSNNMKAFFQALSRITADLTDLYDDLMFYLGALRYMRQMEKLSVPLCYPDILPEDVRGFDVQEMYNPILCVYKKSSTIPNDITFKEGGELLILTGINQGGKTTFLRAVGVTQALFQLGWPVSCRKASISPVKNIVTVFSHEENTNLQHGKLGQELKTVRAGLDIATADSLLLCNEPITGTSPMENLYLSREVLSACKLQGFHGIWVTHIYDLASGASDMNQSLTGSTISSLTAVAVGSGADVSASYIIKRGEPKFTSYAKEVLRRETGVF